jgi:hypothetical protein
MARYWYAVLKDTDRNALGNIAALPEDALVRVLPQERLRSNPTSPNALQSNHLYGPSPSRTSNTSHTLRSWGVVPTVSCSPLPGDDGFMSWEATRQI